VVLTLCPLSLDDKTHGLLGNGKHTPDVCGHGEQDQHTGKDDRARVSGNTFLYSVVSYLAEITAGWQRWCVCV
jgi:hypothetical protein